MVDLFLEQHDHLLLARLELEALCGAACCFPANAEGLHKLVSKCICHCWRDIPCRLCCLCKHNSCGPLCSEQEIIHHLTKALYDIINILLIDNGRIEGQGMPL